MYHELIEGFKIWQEKGNTKVDSYILTKLNILKHTINSSLTSYETRN